ncbi:hypothetical protein DT73_12955 [Mangrovibacter sp. MFB070]|nr:hypothetical protein DT73_12955 [Mangrovibacter sp. MFB070]
MVYRFLAKTPHKKFSGKIFSQAAIFFVDDLTTKSALHHTGICFASARCTKIILREALPKCTVLPKL